MKSSARPRRLCCLQSHRGILIASLVFTLCLCLAMMSKLSRTVEYQFFKADGLFPWLHDAFQASEKFTIVPALPELVVFQHIPRTAGDAMRTHLFHNVTWEHAPYGYEDPAAPFQPLAHQLKVHGPFTVVVPKLATANIVSGFFSSADMHVLANMSGRRVRAFTFLRDPVERVISMHDILSRHSPHLAVPLRLFLNGTEAEYRALFPPDVAERVRQVNLAYASNAMTWQLGSNGFAPRWHEGSTVALRDALNAAQGALKELAFVGLYEDLAGSFLGLWHTVFPHAQVPPIYPWLFYVGTQISFVRLMVRRFAAEASTADVELARALNAADIELYNSAKERLGLRFTMYASYSDFAWHNVLLLSVVFVMLLGITLTVSVGIYCVCSQLSVMLCQMCKGQQQQQISKVK